VFLGDWVCFLFFLVYVCAYFLFLFAVIRTITRRGFVCAPTLFFNLSDTYLSSTKHLSPFSPQRRRMCLSRFWQLDDDGVYLVTYSSVKDEAYPPSVTVTHLCMCDVCSMLYASVLMMMIQLHGSNTMFPTQVRSGHCDCVILLTFLQFLLPLTLFSSYFYTHDTRYKDRRCLQAQQGSSDVDH